MTLFERIKQLADSRGKSLQDVAETVGLSKNIFYKWKTSEPKAKDLEKVADYFDVSVDYLLGRTENPNGLSDSPKIGDTIAAHFRLNTANMDIEDAEELEEELKDYMNFLIQKSTEKKQRRKK